MTTPSVIDLVDGNTTPAAPAVDSAIYLKSGTLYKQTAAGVETAIVNGVQTFNSRTGAVAPLQADYDSFFLTPAEGNAAYDAIGAAASAQAASQPLDADLTALAAAAWAANALPIGTGASALTQTAFAANTFPARASTGNLVAKSITDAGLAFAAAVDAAAETALLNAATASLKGLTPAADFTTVANFRKGLVNILDFGADNTGAASILTALTNAVAALPNGGTIYFPAGTYLVPSAFTITTAGITLLGSSRNNSIITTNSATADMFVVNQWFVVFQEITFATSVNRSAGYCINSPSAGGYSYTRVIGCKFYGTASLKHWNCILIGATLMDVDDIEARFFANNFIEVNGQSDHRISRTTCDNAVQAAGGIVVIATASLLLSQLNIIHAGQGLYITPANAGTIPSIKAVNCFFDNCTNGLNFSPTGTGVWYRSEFTNCWFSSATGAGALLNSAQYDGITFSNCDFYGNAVGIDANAGGTKWTATGSRFAGNTTAAIRLAASANHYPQILGNQIGPVAAFGVNAVGIIIGVGTYTGLVIDQNDLTANTSALTLGAVTVTNWGQYRITDNAGYNPHGAVTTPTFPTSTTVVTNTTGLRVTVLVKSGATAPTVITYNGVADSTILPAVTALFSLALDPGGTIAFTFTAAPTWAWFGN